MQQLMLWGLLVAAALLAFPQGGLLGGAAALSFPEESGTKQPVHSTGDAASPARRLQSAPVGLPPHGSSTDEVLRWLSRVEAAIAAKTRYFSEAYQTSEARLAEVDFYDKSQKEKEIVKRLLRAMVLGDSFVMVVGGMSDTAGHGNLFNDSYPLVMRDTIRDTMALANIKFDVRNMAMGGVPSYPSSMCMKDVWGSDADVIMWDFRMVEHDALKGELYIRQVSQLCSRAVQIGVLI